MSKIYIYVVQNLIDELSFMRYSMINKKEYYEQFPMVAKVGSNIYIASTMKIEPFHKKIKEIFLGGTGAIGEFAIFDATSSIMGDSIIIDTSDKEISKLKRIFGDIRTANEMIGMDSFENEDEIGNDNEEYIHVPDLNELLDKIGKSGMDSLDEFEQGLLSDYSK
jgi:hypothetical protein